MKNANETKRIIGIFWMHIFEEIWESRKNGWTSRHISLPKLNQDDMKNAHRSMTSNEIEAVMRSL
jgi:hypothetical protein